MNSPKISWVRFFSPMMIGVPVKPIRAQLGSALRRFACRVLECERCASSTRTTIASLSLRSPNGSFSADLLLVAARLASQVGVDLAVLLDHREDQARSGPGEQLLDLRDRLADIDGLAGERSRVAELALKVGAVRDRNDLEPAKLGQRPHLPDQEDHRQALARALGVPHDAAATIELAVLEPRLPGGEALDRSLHRPVLLIPADDLDRAPLDRHLKSVKLRTMSSRCAGRSMPATRISWLDSSLGCLAQLGRDVLARDRLRLLPLREVLALRGERPDHRLVEVAWRPRTGWSGRAARCPRRRGHAPAGSRSAATGRSPRRQGR